MTQVGVFGAGGRMGGRIAACLADHPALALACAVGRGDPARFDGCEVVVDVAVASATDDLFARLDGQALVTAVTGRSAEQQALVDAYAERAPVFSAANFSLGVAVLTRLVRDAARAMGGEVEVFELHHGAKADAPSGTALQLARAAADAQGLSWPAARAPVRDGNTGPRGDRQVGLAALRGGAVPGEHTVFVFGDAERLELTHRAADRAVFAHGALRAAAWVVGRPPGRYGMSDLLDN
jgi:4-hydroxy-tetrahydrodipicolinate reductase